MRALIVALAVTGAAGCCSWDPLPPESCVQADARCWDLRRDTCSDDAASPEPPPGVECGASRGTGTCEENGFTRWCDGYFVRPESTC